MCTFVMNIIKPNTSGFCPCAFCILLGTCSLCLKHCFSVASQQVKQNRLFEFKELLHTWTGKATMQILDYNCPRAITCVYSTEVLEETRHYAGEVASLSQICQAATCVSTHGISVMQFHVGQMWDAKLYSKRLTRAARKVHTETQTPANKRSYQMQR